MMQKHDTKHARANVAPALIARAKAGDQAAFTELYEQTYPILYRSICAMTRDEDTAWDVLQESYLRAFRNLDKLGANEAFLSWLRRIAVNETARRMSRRQPVSFSELGDGEDELPEIPDLRLENQPELLLDRDETSRLVREIVADLPEQQHLILGMRYYEELSVQQIAELLQLAPGTVKAHLHSGRKKVEARVRELEQQGVKLYGLSPVAFLVALLRRMEPAPAAGRLVLKQTLAQAGVAAGVKAAGATVTAMTAGQSVLHGLGAKIAAGALSVALIGGGIWGGNKLLSSEQPTAPYQPSETVEAILQTRSAEESIPDTDLADAWTETNPAEITETPEAQTPEKRSGSCGEHLRWHFDPDTGTLQIEGSGEMDSFALEGEHPEWSDLNGSIRKILLPDGLTGIGGGAFEFCSALTEVTIPAGVESIGDSAFGYCEALTSIDVAPGNRHYTSLDGVLLALQEENHMMLMQYPGGKGASSYSIPDGVTAIAYDAFSGCTHLTSITLPKEYVLYASNSFTPFAMCPALTEILVAPDNGCLCSEDGVLLSKDKTELLCYPAGKQASSYTIPASVTTVCTGAFRGNGFLEHLTVPGTVNRVDDYAFSGCAALQQATVQEGVTEIGFGAFEECAALTEISIPSSTTMLGEEYGFYVFPGCTRLRKIDVAPENPNYSSTDGILFDKEHTTLLLYPAGKQEASYAIPGGVTSIGVRAFEGCACLTGVSIPDSVEIIENAAFRNCTALTGVTIPAAVTSIYAFAFEHCTALTELSIPDGVTSIESDAFLGCSALTSVTIPDSVTEIDACALGYLDKHVNNWQAVETEKVEGFTIYGKAGSEAQRYAEENGFAFQAN